MHKEKLSLPNLHVTREEAYQKIQAQIDAGQKLQDSQIGSERELKEIRDRASQWATYNETLLLALFDNSLLLNQYKEFCKPLRTTRPLTLRERIDWYKNDMRKRINSLKGILKQLELINELPIKSTYTTSPEQITEGNNEVFIVHGHDKAVKSEISSFVKQLGFKPIILDEQPGSGQTIIEKFEEYAGNVCFAIVLLTPDDIGSLKDEQNNPNPRARQNVIFEMGYFLKGLGRGRVCLMCKEKVEVPSDLAGVEYISLDPNDNWKRKLVREMEAARIPVEK